MKTSTLTNRPIRPNENAKIRSSRNNRSRKPETPIDVVAQPLFHGGPFHRLHNITPSHKGNLPGETPAPGSHADSRSFSNCTIVAVPNKPALPQQSEKCRADTARTGGAVVTGGLVDGPRLAGHGDTGTRGHGDTGTRGQGETRCRRLRLCKECAKPQAATPEVFSLCPLAPCPRVPVSPCPVPPTSTSDTQNPELQICPILALTPRGPSGRTHADRRHPTKQTVRSLGGELALRGSGNSVAGHFVFRRSDSEEESSLCGRRWLWAHR